MQFQSNLQNACFNVHEPYLPLMANANEDQFKLYINDSGLFCCIYGFETKLAVLNDTLRGNARGGFMKILFQSVLLNAVILYITLSPIANTR